MTDCIFCRIAAKEVPAKIVYEDDNVVAFHDMHPKYPLHILVIPKVHISSAAELRPAHDTLVGKLLRVGGELAKAHGVAGSGFRLLANTGADAGQGIDHLHVHMLGGEPLRPI